jgi:hypothetical protein
MHGTTRGYHRGCRCLLCRASWAAYIKARRVAPTARIPAKPVKAHLKRLILTGVGMRQISDVSGVSRAHLYRLRRPTTKTVHPSVATKILGVVVPKGGGVVVSSYKTRKMMTALVAEGWTLRSLGRKIRKGSTIYRAMAEHDVRLSTERAVERLYKALMGEAWDPDMEGE